MLGFFSRFLVGILSLYIKKIRDRSFRCKRAIQQGIKHLFRPLYESRRILQRNKKGWDVLREWTIKTWMYGTVWGTRVDSNTIPVLRVNYCLKDESCVAALPKWGNRKVGFNCLLLLCDWTSCFSVPPQQSQFLMGAPWENWLPTPAGYWATLLDTVMFFFLSAHKLKSLQQFCLCAKSLVNLFS